MHRFDRTPLIRTLPLIAAGFASLIGAAVADLSSRAWIVAVARMTGAAVVLPGLMSVQGMTVAAMVVAGVLVAGLVWSSLYLLFGQGGVLVRKGRRARAAVWGAGLEPFPEEERRLPRDLDQPLAAFDPDALPAVPLQPVPMPTPPQLCAATKESSGDIAEADSDPKSDLTPDEVPPVIVGPVESPIDILPIAGLRSGEPPRPSEDAITYLRSVDISNSLSSFGRRNAPISAEPNPLEGTSAEPSISALLARLERGAAGMRQG